MALLWTYFIWPVTSKKSPLNWILSALDISIKSTAVLALVYFILSALFWWIAWKLVKKYLL